MDTKRVRWPLIFTIVLTLAFVLSCIYQSPEQDRPEYLQPDCGPPTGVVYPDLFWFVQITDIHQSRDNGSDVFSYGITPKGSYDSFLEQMIYIHDVVRPAFVAATGDLVDGGILEQTAVQWEDYRHSVWGACYDDTTYHDLPGNHDCYYDADYRYFREYSISGDLHHAWTIENQAGRFAFIAFNTSLAGYNGGYLSDGERDWLIAQLEDSRDCEYRILMAHHNIPYNGTRELHGPEGILSRAGVSAFLGGHIHTESEYSDSGVVYLVTDAMYESDQVLGKGSFRIVSLDGLNMASAHKLVAGDGPQVIVTSPQDLMYSTAANPHGHIVSGITRIGALAFSTDEIDLWAGVDDYDPVPMNAQGDSRYEAHIDFDNYPADNHRIRVWADGMENSRNAADEIEVVSQ